MVYVIEGSGVMYMVEDSMKIQAGDYFHFPPGTVHAVKVDPASHMKVLSVQMPEFFGRDRHFLDQD